MNEVNSIPEEESVVLGRPKWDLIFHDLIASTYKVRKDLLTEQDIDLQCILICIHEALGKPDRLHQLAQICVDHNRSSELILKPPKRHVWTPN